MEFSLVSIQSLVTKIKEEIFSNLDLYTFVSPSAYDTAWLARVPDPQQNDCPMFKGCLNWVVKNQKEEGYWGESNGEGLPTIDTLPATLACMVALKKWNVGDKNIEKGLAFIYANTETILKGNYHHLPRWFAIVFPAMVELAQVTGLQLVFPDELNEVISGIFSHRQQILEKEELVDKYQYPPLLSYLETLPSTYAIDQQAIVEKLSEDGSLFQSPSATAQAFIATGNPKCMDYLKSIVQRCPHGVPPMYPMDEGLIKLCLADQIEKLGLAEHFSEEIEEILTQVYRSYMNQDSRPKEINFVPAKLYKDSLAFRLLRMHGYKVTPGSFSWFLNHEDILDHIEQNCEWFISIMYNVYRATDFMFSGEYKLEEARSFSRKLIEKTRELKNRDDNLVMMPTFQKVIEQELSVPWIARLDHLDHRMWIEVNKVSPLWMGKASFYRLSCLNDDKLMQLAAENYKFRQSIYRNELEQLKRWSKVWGLTDMGFGREKTTYSYFAVASSSSLPPDSQVRMIVAKSAILVTVADDFFDMEGSLIELQALTEAVQKWDGKGLSGHGKVIFEALNNFVSDMAAKHIQQQGKDITKKLRDIWGETFASWLTESTWSATGYVPSIDEYLETGMISIAAHTLVLPASCFLNPSLPNSKLKPAQYEIITKLLMTMTRLLNDAESYEKEKKQGKMNLLHLLLKANPQADIENSGKCIKEILLHGLKKELLEHILVDDLSDMPKSSKFLHLACLKVFHMFFNSSNRFDSNTELLQDINNALFVPLEFQTSKPLKSPPLVHSRKKKGGVTISFHFDQSFKYFGSRSFVRQDFPRTISRDGYGKVFMPPKLNVCFI